MKNSLWLLCLFCLFIINLNAQTGPGGIGNNSSNGLWLRADNINLPNGTSITSWSDDSGNGNNANQTHLLKRPTFYTSSTLNNMPILRFDGYNDEMLIADADILDNSSGITMYAVIRPSNLNGQPRGILGKRISYTTSSNYSYAWFFWGSNRLNLDVVTQNNRFDTGSTAFSNATNYILSWNFDGTLPSSLRSNIVNGSSVVVTSSESSTAIPNSNQPIAIGALNVGYGTYLGADYAEVIQFNHKLNTAQQVIVQNYLSSKYNIALAANDFYIQDNPARGNFDYNVAGIGQASDGTNHTDSRGSGIVRVSSPSSLSNGDYLFWGENTNNASYTFTTNTTNYYEQLDSQWRVSKVNNLGTVTMSFDVSLVDLTNKQSCQPLQLIVDNDSDFSSPTIYDLTISGGVATATNVSLSDADYFTLRYLDQIVWDGLSFYNGSGVANAPNNTDNCLKLTIMPGAIAPLNSHTSVREVEVQNSAVLNVADGILLEVEQQVEINGTLDLLGEAQLIQNHLNVTSNSGTGSLFKRQQGTTNLYNYNYWSSPVNRNGNWQIGFLEDSNGILNFTNSFDANPSTSPTTISQRWLYQYNASTGYNGWSEINTVTPILPGIGYTMKGSGGASTEYQYIFKGIPNDGNYSYAVIDGNDFLIGNPYPSTLDANQFINDNLSVIDGTLHFWEHFAANNSHYLEEYQGGYATYNLMMSLPAIADTSGLTSGLGTASKAAPTNRISVGQGFFVTIQNSGSLEFNNGQRVFARESLSESVYYRQNQNQSTSLLNDERMKVQLSFKDPSGYKSIIGLGYDENTTIGYDNGYDAKVFESKKNGIYWSLEEERLSILALPEFEVSQELPILIELEDEGVYNFGINEMQNVPEDFKMYLKDAYTNTLYELSSEETPIWLNEMEDNQRFSVVFQNSTLHTDDYSFNGIRLIYDPVLDNISLLNVETSSIDRIYLYNVMGQELWVKEDSDVSLQFNVSNLETGAYIVRVHSDRGYNSFKFIKN